jgi:hypothetical protein
MLISFSNQLMPLPGRSGATTILFAIDRSQMITVLGVSKSADHVHNLWPGERPNRWLAGCQS